MRTNAPRTRSRTRVCKNQKISLHFSRASSPHPSAAKRKKKWKGNFWFCFAVSVSEKSTIILSLLVALFSALTATEAHPYPRLVVTLNFVPSTAEVPTYQNGASPYKSSLRNGEAQICMCFPPPPVRTHHPRHFEKHYKTAGMAPVTKQILI